MNYSLDQLKRIQTIKQNLSICFLEMSSQDKKFEIQTLLDKITKLEHDLLGGHSPNFTKKEELMNKVLTTNNHFSNPPNDLSDFRVFANMNLHHPEKIESKRRELMIPKRNASLLIQKTIDNSTNAEISILVNRLTPMFYDKFQGKSFQNEQQLKDEIMVELIRTSSVPRELREEVAYKIVQEYIRLQDVY